MLSEENDLFKTKVSNPLRCLKMTDVKNSKSQCVCHLLWCPSIMSLNFVDGICGAFWFYNSKLVCFLEKMTVKLCVILQLLTYMLLGYLQTYRSWLCKRTGSSKYGYNICGNPEVFGAYICWFSLCNNLSQL